jgi:hypothetical protein
LLGGLARLAWAASDPRRDLFGGAPRAVEDENNKAAEKTANHKDRWVVCERKKKRSRYQSDDCGSPESHDDCLKAIFDYFADAREKRFECVGFIHGPRARLQLFLRSSILRFLYGSRCNGVGSRARLGIFPFGILGKLQFAGTV